MDFKISEKYLHEYGLVSNTHFEQGEFQLSQGNVTQAIREFQKILQYDQDNFLILCLLGGLYWEISLKKQVESYKTLAIAYLEKSLSFESENPMAQQILSNLYCETKQWELALNACRAVLFGEKSGFFHNEQMVFCQNLLLSCRNTTNTLTGIDTLLSFLDTCPDIDFLGEVHGTIAYCYEKTGDNPAAFRHYELFLQTYEVKTPKSSKSRDFPVYFFEYLRLSAQSQEKRILTTAMNWYLSWKECLKICENEKVLAGIYNNLACIYQKNKEVSLALEYFHRAFKKNSLPALENLLAHYLESRNYERVAELLETYSHKKLSFHEISRENPYFHLVDSLELHRIHDRHLKITCLKLCHQVEILKSQHQLSGSSYNIGHFTSLAAVNDMITPEKNSLRFRMSNVIHMNDPSEGNEFYEILRAYSLKTWGDVAGFLDELTSSTQKISNTYLISFSKKTDSLPMWVHYGEKGNGVNISLEKNIFKTPTNQLKTSALDGNSDEIQENSHHYTLYEMRYHSKNQRSISILHQKILGLIQEIDQYFQDKIQSEELNLQRHSVVEIASDLLDNVRFLVKNSDYAYENELRVVYSQRDSRKIKTQAPANKAQSVPKLYMDMEVDIPYEDLSVTIGPTVENQQEVAAYLKHCGIHEVKISAIQYR